MATDRAIQDSSRLRIREQLVCQRGTLASTGKLDLSRREQPGVAAPACLSRLKDLTELGVQPHLKWLDLSGLPLDSLRTLAGQPGLTTLIADRSQISSLAGLGRHPRLKAVSFVGAPVAANFRISAAVAVGQQLAAINGAPVSARERALASRFPLVARALVELGWDAEVPAPPPAQFKALAAEFNVRLKGVDSEFRTLEGQRYLRPPPVLPLREAASPPASPPADEERPRPAVGALAMEVRAKLAKIGVRVACDEDEVLQAVESLAGIARQLQEAYAQRSPARGAGETGDGE